MAAAVNGSLRTEDVFARYGGEEFAVILRGIDLANAYHVAERFRISFESLRIEANGTRRPDHHQRRRGLPPLLCADDLAETLNRHGGPAALRGQPARGATGSSPMG
jgi:GGDEF domain-containing protein